MCHSEQPVAADLQAGDEPEQAAIGLLLEAGGDVVTVGDDPDAGRRGVLRHVHAHQDLAAADQLRTGVGDGHQRQPAGRAAIGRPGRLRTVGAARSAIASAEMAASHPRDRPRISFLTQILPHPAPELVR